MEMKSLFAGRIRKCLAFHESQGFRTDKHEDNLRLFDRYCCAFKPLAAELTQEIVEGWLAFESAKRHLGVMCVKASVIRSFANYLAAFGENAYVLPRGLFPQRTDYTPYILKDDELSALFAEIDRSCQNHECTQAVKGSYSVLFRLVYSCGLRPQEGRNAKCNDLDLDSGVLLLRETKTHNERMVGLSVPMWNMLKKYKARLDKVAPASEFLFPMASGRPMSKDWMGDFLVGCWRRSNPEAAKAHPRLRVYDLRHRFASEVLQRWIDDGKDIYKAIPVLRAYMGHSTLAGTLYYVHLLPERLRLSEAIDWKRLNSIIPEVNQ